MKLSPSLSKFVCAAALLAASSIAAYAAAPPSVNLSPPPAQEAKQLNSTMPERAADFNYTLTKGESPPFIAMSEGTGNGVMLGVADIGPSIGLPAFKAKVADEMPPRLIVINALANPKFADAWPPRWMINGASLQSIPTLWRPSFALNTNLSGATKTFDNSSDTLRGTGKAFAMAAASRNWPASLGFA